MLVVPQGLGDVRGAGYHWGKVEEGEYLLLRAIRKAKEDYRIDDKRVVLTGFSQGGSLTFDVALRHPQVVTGAIPVAGSFDERIAPLPEGPREGLPRFCIINGALDKQADNNRLAAKKLEAAGAAVEIKIYHGIGHAFPPNRHAELRTALEFVLSE